MNALVLVDIQQDFLPGGALAVPDGDGVIAVANRLQPHFDLVIATLDWHPADHGSFAANHPGKKVGERVMLDGLEQILWPVHCVAGSPGADFAAGLDTSRIARVFHKGTDPRLDSYSGFFDKGYRQPTGLAEYLKSAGVRDVYILGLATDYCVKFTALDAQQLGFTTFLVEDGCRGVNLDEGDAAAAVETLRSAGVRVVRSDDVLTRGPARGAEPIAESNHLRLVRVGRWEYVQRKNVSGVVTVVALTSNNEVLLVEQYRPPVRARVIEFPAGLAGDRPEQRDESLADAARRELLEETGFVADSLQPLFRGASSAGLTDEMVTFFLARGADRIAAGGGEGGEDIQIHAVPLERIDAWLEDKMRSGRIVAARLYTGIYLLKRALRDHNAGSERPPS